MLGSQGIENINGLKEMFPFWTIVDAGLIFCVNTTSALNHFLDFEWINPFIFKSGAILFIQQFVIPVNSEYIELVMN